MVWKVGEKEFGGGELLAVGVDVGVMKKNVILGIGFLQTNLHNQCKYCKYHYYYCQK